MSRVSFFDEGLPDEVTPMFEYQHGRRPREWVELLLLGVLGLLASFSTQAVASRWGARAGLVLPGLVLLVVSGVQYARANRSRERYLESEGVVVSVERHRSGIPTLLQTEENPDDDWPIHGKATRRRASRGERSETYRGTVTFRFELANGDLRFAEASGYFSYQVGDEVVMLYLPQASEEALPEEVARIKIYSEFFGYGFMTLLYFGGALFFFWLFT